MARSVYVPSRAAQVAYANFECEEGDDFAFDDAVANVVCELKAKYPSLDKPYRPRYVGNEGRVILENKLVSIVVSEYCGLVALSVVVEAGYGALAERFADKFDFGDVAGYFGPELRKLGTFSNGEAVFRLAK